MVDGSSGWSRRRAALEERASWRSGARDGQGTYAVVGVISSAGSVGTWRGGSSV